MQPANRAHSRLAPRRTLEGRFYGGGRRTDGAWRGGGWSSAQLPEGAGGADGDADRPASRRPRAGRRKKLDLRSGADLNEMTRTIDGRSASPIKVGGATRLACRSTGSAHVVAAQRALGPERSLVRRPEICREKRGNWSSCDSRVLSLAMLGQNGGNRCAVYVTWSGASVIWAGACMPRSSVTACA
jgi:hypothetical protein